MNQSSSHLTAAQIEQYVDDSSGSSKAVEAHIQECDQCRKKALESGRRNLPPGCPASRHSHPGFPGDDLLMEFAAGLCPPAIASQVLEHVSECEYCAPLLKTYLEDISDEEAEQEPTEERAPARTSQRVRKERPFWFGFFQSRRMGWASGLAFAAALLIAAFLTVPLAINAFKLSGAKTLLASAAVENRVTEMRIPWAPYSKWSPVRGASDMSFSDRPKLAHAFWEANNHQDSADPRWIRVNGRVNLLMGNLEKATDLFKRAAEKGLDDPGTKIDLAIAYFQTAQAEAQKNANPDEDLIKLNRDKATDLFLQALDSPRITADERAAALFNLAIAYEKLEFLNLAVPRWKEYLQLDSTSSWADEAREHLKEFDQRIPPPRPQEYRTPGYFLRHLEDSDTRGSSEEYLDVALRFWLPDAMEKEKKDAEALPAVHKLAEMLQEQHGDPWLHDFLQALRPGDLEAVRLLADALTSNRHGYPKEAERAADAAAPLFLQRGNLAGALWAGFESVYAKQRLGNEGACAREGQVLAGKLKHTTYKWLQIQAGLDQAYCNLNKKQLDLAIDESTLAQGIAASAGFHSLALRARAVETDLKPGSGACAKNWGAAASGLRQYWEGLSMPVRLYEFYGRFAGCLREEGFLYAARALQERDIAILDHEWNLSDVNISVVAAVHKAMADLLEELGERDLAQREYAIAAEKRTENRVGELMITLQSAQGQLEARNPRGALNTLEDARGTFMAADSDLIHLNFYGLLGDSYLDLHDVDQAEAAYARSLEVAEDGMGSLREIGERRQWIAETGAVYRRMAGLLLEKGKYEEALQFWEWYQDRSSDAEPAAAARGGKAAWAAMEKDVFAQPLPAPTSEARLVFAGIRDRVHVWVISKAGIETFWIASKPDELSERIGAFLRKCSNRSSSISDLEQESVQLFSLILQPALSRIGDSDLVIADLDQSMNGLVLETLKSPDGWYFGLRYPVMYSPGFTRELQLHRPVGAMDGTGLLVDASTSSAGPSLDRIERTPLLQSVPGFKVLNGDGATPQDVRRGLEGRRLFHFVGHGVANGLVLNREWTLTPEQFAPKSLQNLQLAVLAACSTGSAKNGLLDTKSLVNAFLRAGVPTVVASHWEVDSRSTTDLMSDFYTDLKNGSAAAQAMRRARQNLFRTHTHPYYWAAFTISGRMS